MPAPSTDGQAAPDSEPGSGKGQALKARNAALATEIQQLQEQLKTRHALKAELDALGISRPSDDKPAAPSAAPASTLAQTVANPDVSAPLLTEEQFFAQYPSAPYGQYAVYAGRYAARSEFAQLQQQAVQQQAVSQWTDAVAPLREQYPDYDAIVSTAFQGLPDSPTNTALAGAIQELRAPHLLLHLGLHPEITARLVTLSPQAALLELGAIHGSLRSQSAAPPRTVTTTAPPPPTTLGQKAADQTGDELMAAVKADDVARFRAERLRQKIAATRR